MLQHIDISWDVLERHRTRLFFSIRSLFEESTLKGNWGQNNNSYLKLVSATFYIIKSRPLKNYE